MSRSHRHPSLAAAAALVVALLALATAGAGAGGPAGAQAKDGGRLRVTATDASKYPAVTATVTVARPDPGRPLTGADFSVTSGTATVPASVRRVELSRRRIVLVVDPGQDGAGAVLVRNAAISVAQPVMPSAAVTVVSGGASPKVVQPPTHNFLLVAKAIRLIASAPSGTLEGLAVGLNQASKTIPPAAVIAVANGAGGTAKEAKTIATAAGVYRIPIDILLPGLATAPAELSSFTANGGSVTAAPSIVAAIPAVDRLVRGLDNWFEVSFRAPAAAGSTPDLALTVKADGVVSRSAVPVQPPAAASPTTVAPAATTLPAPATSDAGDSGGSGTSAGLLGAGLLVVLMAVAVGIVLARRRAQPPRHRVGAAAVDGGGTDEAFSSLASTIDGDPTVEAGQPAAGPGPPPSALPAAPRTTFQGLPADDRSPRPEPTPFGPRPEAAPVHPSPTTPPAPAAPAAPAPARVPTATGRWDRIDPRPVTTDPLDRNRPGARWWMYQRPDTGHQASSRPSGSGDRGTQPSDDPEPGAGPPAPSRQAPEPPLWRVNGNPRPEPDTAMARELAKDNTFMAPVVGGTLLILAAAAIGHWGTTALGPVLIPVGAILLTIGFGRLALQNHPEEQWVAKIMLLGVLTKLVLSFAREFTLVHKFEQPGDAAGYDSFGKEFVRFWTGMGSNPRLEDLRETNFLRWFTGVVYYVFGSNFLTGFFVFGLLAVTGSYFWYRATVNAVPFIDRKLYLVLVMFMPSIVFWPAVIGKEALMQFGIGAMALGTAYIMRARLYRGLVICVGAGWLLWVVRPHLLALVTVAGAGGYLLGKVRQKDGRASSLISRPVGMVVVALLVSFTITQGANFLGLQDLSVDSIQNRLDSQTVATSRGDSEFKGSGASLNPLDLPQGAVTVLLRPLPWETDSPLQLLSSAESMCLAAFMVIRIRSLRVALTRARVTPYLMYCWILTALYCVAFSSFANFGLLVRQRSLVLPALCVLLAVDPDLAARTTARGVVLEDAAEVEAAEAADVAEALEAATGRPGGSR